MSPRIDEMQLSRIRQGFLPPLFLRGAEGLSGLLKCYQTSPYKSTLITKLDLLASVAKDVRVRYGARLLLDKLLGNKMPREQVKWYLTAMLPKTDMHVHIDGSVRLETVMDLAAKHNVDLAAVLQRAKDDPSKGFCLQDIPALPKDPTIDNIRKLSQIEKAEPNFLKMLFMGFDYAISVMQTKQGLERIAYELVEDSWKEGVMHLGAIFAPCLHREKGLSYDEIIEAVIAGLERGKAKYGMTWELSLAIYRGVYTEKHPEHPMETAKVAKRWAERYPKQIGIDVVGAEFQTRLDHYWREFELLKNSNVILRAHAGEGVGQAFNIETAWQWGMRRIGHGIHLSSLNEYGKPIKQWIIDSGMVFEVSPVSNIKCLCLSEKVEENQLFHHPINELLLAGAKVTLCTDDRTVMMVDNVSQMLDLETVFDWPLFHRGRVGSIPAVLARNGFGAIADPALATRYQRELPDIIAEIEALIAALG